MEEKLKNYIIERIEVLKYKPNYDNGFTCREEIEWGLFELQLLAKRMRIDVSPIYSFDLPKWLKN